MPRKSAANMLKAKPARPPRKKRAMSRRRHLTLRGVAILFLLLLFAVVGLIGFVSGASAGRIADGVSAGPIIVGGLTPDEATNLLAERVTGYSLSFKTEGMEDSFNPITVLDKEGRALAAIDADAVVTQAYSIGREESGLLAFFRRSSAYLFGYDVGLPFQVNQKALEEELKVRFAGVFSPAVNAQLNVSVNADGTIVSEVIPERPGTNLTTDEATALAVTRLANLDQTPIDIAVRYDQPKISAEEAEATRPEVENAVKRGPITLMAKDVSWDVSRGLLASWLDVVPQEEGPARLGFDLDDLNKYLESRAPEFAIVPVDAVFEQEEGKVTRIENHVNGEKLDIEGSIIALQAYVFGEEPESDTVDLPIVVVPPELTLEKANPYGVKDILGVGSSNFRGSPKNRRTNIAVGAATLDGLVVPADAEFSLMKALGEIDGEHGYTQELVIKKDETVPEYGGGLCQIGTTTFRTVLESGLPVLERRNHSYRVSYYELDGDGVYIGPGKDATIYDPWPDFKFKNDTGHPIVFKTDIDGNRLDFTFWGVDDGRVAEQTDAVVWDRTDPPEKREILTEDLPPGEEKCTEHPHPGAKASFTYTVTYPDGEIEEEKFYSHYRPWGEVCLIGIDPDAEPLPDDMGSGTEISADASGVQGE